MNPKLDRRQALTAFGTVSLAGVLAACGDDGTATKTTATTSGTDFDSSATCRLTAELTEGPFYFDVDRIRSDITEGRDGTALRLALRVRDANTCEPIPDAVVDIWHCDATGSYSMEGETYLRGAQVTDREGKAEFRTIYPGWYPGRTVHIHAKVHLDKQTVLTTQLYTSREWDDRAYANAAYEPGRDQYNETDGLFDESLVMTLSKDGDGVRGVMTFAVDRST